MWIRRLIKDEKEPENNIKVKQIKEYNINFTRPNILSQTHSSVSGVEILDGYFASKFLLG